MPILKIVPGAYTNEDALERTIRYYIFRKALIIGGLAVNPQHAVEQMREVKKAWNKLGGKQLHHFVLTFSDVETKKIASVKKVVPLSYAICEYFCNDFQIVFGVHYHNGCYHVHFSFNSVSFRSGVKYVQRNVEDCVLRDFIRDIYIPATLRDILPIRKFPVYYY